MIRSCAAGNDQPECRCAICSSGRSMAAEHPYPSHLDATVLICTYNRGNLLGETLDAIAKVRTTFTWEVVVVDNNSTDHTRAVVESRQASYPVTLRYLFEPRQGNSFALNTGIAA